MFSLDELNQHIWNFGFDSLALSELDIISKAVCNGDTLFERIPQAQQFGLSRGSEVLCAAAIICRGCPCTESETRAIYNTDDLINDGAIQNKIVESWARIKGIWIDSPEEYFDNVCNLKDDGTESKVFFNIVSRVVYKLISLKHYNVLRLALDRIIIHNAIFSDSALKIVGFGRNSDNSFVVIAEQPYIEGNPVSGEEVLSFMKNIGFEEAGEDYGMHLNYKTSDLYIGDLNEYNLLRGERGVHVFDADCRLNVPTLGCGGSYIIPSVNVDFNTPCFFDK